MRKNQDMSEWFYKWIRTNFYIASYLPSQTQFRCLVAGPYPWILRTRRRRRRRRRTRRTRKRKVVLRCCTYVPMSMLLIGGKSISRSRPLVKVLGARYVCMSVWYVLNITYNWHLCCHNQVVGLKNEAFTKIYVNLPKIPENKNIHRHRASDLLSVLDAPRQTSVFTTYNLAKTIQLCL